MSTRYPGFRGVRAYLIRQIIAQWLIGGPRYAKPYVDRLRLTERARRLARARRRLS